MKDTTPALLPEHEIFAALTELKRNCPPDVVDMVMKLEDAVKDTLKGATIVANQAGASIKELDWKLKNRTAERDALQADNDKLRAADKANLIGHAQPQPKRSADVATAIQHFEKLIEDGYVPYPGFTYDVKQAVEYIAALEASQGGGGQPQYLEEADALQYAHDLLLFHGAPDESRTGKPKLDIEKHINALVAILKSPHPVQANQEKK